MRVQSPEEALIQALAVAAEETLAKTLVSREHS